MTALPLTRPLARADLSGDGHPYELIDGTLPVSPGRALPHLERRDGASIQVGRAAACGRLALAGPWPVQTVPSRLLA